MLGPKKHQYLWLFALLFLAVGAQAQNLPNIQARFANPIFIPEKGTYLVDVQLKTEQGDEYLFGFNVRFFYDAELMEFDGLSDFADHYGLLGSSPKNYIGDSNSGRALFALSGAAAYINTAVQLFGEEDQALVLKKDEWTTAFRANFKIHDYLDKDEDFCPSIIWDLEKPEKSRGGFLPNEDGIVFTVLERDPATSQISAPSFSSASAFNWEYMNRSNSPYGMPVSKECISLNEVATSVPNGIGLVYQVFQNRPNPFDTETFIGFRIPKSAKVKLRIFDAAGKTILEKKGDYTAGYHSIRIENSEYLLGSSQALFYQIETAEYLSPTFKMNRVQR